MSAERNAPRKDWISDREYVIHDAEQNAVEGLSEAERDRQALEAACLEGLIHTKHGYRYRPSLGADAVERIVADRGRLAVDEFAAEVERRISVEYLIRLDGVVLISREHAARIVRDLREQGAES